MPTVNWGELLKELAYITRKQWWLSRISWRLDLYIWIARMNKKLYDKINTMTRRYDELFCEDLGGFNDD